ncbi:sugar phosphate isomerase/epimerase family protein [Sporosarcina koreensis]|uniref:sugar phosphate isomerase/epimerase family protein n=1 Tax=Sporosarcina koreensis TaxID=334735 RepID=UPI00058D2C94|nr:sugar phosphate isomerase/epimerase [Sporosarcina koreensis]
MEKWLSLWSMGQTKTEQDMKAIRQAGFAGVEIWAEHHSAEADMALAADAGLKVGLHLPFHDLNLATPYEGVGTVITERNKYWLGKLGELGGGHAVIHGGSAWASEDEEDAGARVVGRLQQIRALADEHNVQLLFENQIPDKLNYMHIFPSSVDEWMSILDKTQTAACLDTGHLAVLGAPLAETVARLGNRLASVHFSDNDMKGDLHQLPGDGATQTGTRELVKILKENGYQGPVVFEINPYTYTLADILEHPSVTAQLDE